MTRAAGGLVDVADIPVMGSVLAVTANVAGGYTASLAGAQLMTGGTHAALSGTIARSPLQRAIVICNIPAPLRPTQARRLTCALGNAVPGAGESGTTAIQIATNGDVILTGNATMIGAQTTVYLDSIIYPL